MAKAKAITKISDVRPQVKNSNRHTQRGLGLLESSIQNDGWIGAMTIAADGETFDGSARAEVGVAAGFDDAIIVDSDGSKPVIVRRIDIPNADDKRAKRLGVAANRIAQIDFDPDLEVLAELVDEGVELNDLWSDEEMAEMLAGLNIEETENESPYDMDLVGKNIYEPSDKEVSPEELFEEPRKDLLGLIEKVKNPIIKKMLLHRYSFFVDYKMPKIADYYCHNPTKEEQEAFEALGLVILDKDNAIARGFMDYVEEVEAIEDAV